MGNGVYQSVDAVYKKVISVRWIFQSGKYGDVIAGAKCSAVPGNHMNKDFRVLITHLKGLPDFSPKNLGQGIQFLRAIESDQGYPVSHFI
jgi:hypothetical protein